jgi:hypothetical protein
MLRIWQDPKVDNTMYHNDFLEDWFPNHLKDYSWYIDCPQDCTPPFEIALKEIHELGFQEKLASFRGSNI